MRRTLGSDCTQHLDDFVDATLQVRVAAAEVQVVVVRVGHLLEFVLGRTRHESDRQRHDAVVVELLTTTNAAAASAAAGGVTSSTSHRCVVMHALISVGVSTQTFQCVCLDRTLVFCRRLA